MADAIKEGLTITQQRKAMVARARESGAIVHDGTRGNASYPAHKPALTALIATLKDTLKSEKPVAYGESPLGEKKHIARAMGAINEHYPYDDLAPERVAFFPGAQFGLLASMSALLKKGNPETSRTILAQWPGYPNYEALFNEARKLAETSHASFGHIPVEETGCASAEAIRAAIQKAKDNGTQVDAIILTIPSNPQGKIPNVAEQREIIQTLQKHPDIAVMLDESFMEIDFRDQAPDRFRSMTHTAKEMGETTFLDRVFVVRSGTKAAAMAGIRPNMMILPNDKEIIQPIKAATARFLGNTGFLEQEAMAEWLHASRRDHEKVSAHYAKNLQPLTKGLQALGMPYEKPEGGFFIMLDASELLGKLPEDMQTILGKESIETDEDLFRLFLKVGHSNGKEKLGVMPGADFGYEPEEGKVRFCFGVDAHEVTGAVNVLINLTNRIRAHRAQSEGQGYNETETAAWLIMSSARCLTS